MTSEELKLRTKEFAHRCVKLGLALPKTDLGGHLPPRLALWWRKLMNLISG